MNIKEKAFHLAKIGKGKATGLALFGTGLVASSSQAQVIIPELDPIAPVVDVDSVVSQVAAFGGIILLAWAGLFIAFGLSYKLVRRLRGTA